MYVTGGRGWVEIVRAYVQCMGLCFLLKAPLFFPFSSMPLPGGMGRALHPLGSPCSESKADD